MQRAKKLADRHPFSQLTLQFAATQAYYYAIFEDASYAKKHLVSLIYLHRSNIKSITQKEKLLSESEFQLFKPSVEFRTSRREGRTIVFGSALPFILIWDLIECHAFLMPPDNLASVNDNIQTFPYI